MLQVAMKVRARQFRNRRFEVIEQIARAPAMFYAALHKSQRTRAVLKQNLPARCPFGYQNCSCAASIFEPLSVKCCIFWQENLYSLSDSRISFTDNFRRSGALV